jgi:hypothetical protein
MVALDLTCTACFISFLPRRKYRWKPLREACGLPLTQSAGAVEELKATSQISEPVEETTSSDILETPNAVVSSLQLEENSPVKVKS